MKAQLPLFDLIAGQIPRPGRAFLERELSRARDRTARNQRDADARNDYALANLYLGNLEEARRILETLLKEQPPAYATLSNLGAVYKEFGEFALAADATEAALALRPGGHLGMGDGAHNYFVRMLRFREATAQGGGQAPGVNFLGYQYHEFPKRDLPPTVLAEVGAYPDELTREEHFKKLRTLLELDPAFADGFLVLGDYLFKKNDWSQALMAYGRALDLNHPNRPIAERRFALAYSKLRMWAWLRPAFPPRWTEPKSRALSRMKADFREAAAWIAKFHETESEFIEGNYAAEPARIVQEMERRGIAKAKPRDYGARQSMLGFVFSLTGWAIILAVLAASLWIAGWFRRRRDPLSSAQLSPHEFPRQRA